MRIVLQKENDEEHRIQMPLDKVVDPRKTEALAGRASKIGPRFL